jgi:hypothetical protein
MAAPYKNLTQGQYQIGDIVFGRRTNIVVENFDPKSYDVNAQDYQVTRSDEVRFGYDSFKPTTIEISMTVIRNWLLNPFKGTIPNFWADRPTASQLAAEWRGNDVRTQWGEMKPLYFCGKDQVGKIIYGRPGQFTMEKSSHLSTLTKCVGEFRRADTLVYSAVESTVLLSHNAVPQYLRRTRGDAPSWLRIIGQGPLTNPVITIGDCQIRINDNFAAGEVFEVSSYPWQRRAVDNDSNNLRNLLVGNSSYLDTLKLPYNQFVPVRWTSDQVNTWVPWPGNANWNLEIEELNQRKLPSGFTVIAGKPVIRFDLINPSGPTTFIGGREFGGTDACLYTEKTYQTTTQFMQCRVVEPFAGRSAMVMMSNLTMTNFAALEVESGINPNNKLVIRTGTAFNNTTARATYTHSTSWSENDLIGFGYNPTTKVFTAFLNGTSVLTWTDSTNIVTANASTNKYSGFIFDLNNNLLTLGTGFKDVTSYDNVVVPADTGSVRLYWRDAWSSID